MLSDSSAKKTVVIVGGGIVGLATGFKLLQACHNIRLILIEKEKIISTHQTGNNSGVIHSGLYYKPGSMKALSCRRGYSQLLAFCREENIQHEICGKLVVASTESGLSRLDELYRRGLANGLQHLEFLGVEQIREIEPYCVGIKALRVPEAGIVDYRQVAMAYAGKLLDFGSDILLGETVQTILQNSKNIVVVGQSRTWTCDAVVVCAGLHADRLARKTLPDLPIRILPFRGEYYRLKSSAQYLVNHLIYPVPDPEFPFLGVHFTRMIQGGIECGPNAVFAWGREAYRKTDFVLGDFYESLMWPGFQKMVQRYWRSGLSEYYRSFSKAAFVHALKKLIPDIRSEHLEAGGAGIRAQACDRNGSLLDDFDVRFDGKIIYVCNAPSPAATASLAIGATLATHVLSLIK